MNLDRVIAYKTMESELLKCLEKDKNCFEIKGPNDEPEAWKLFKDDPPTGVIGHFYVAFVNKLNDQSEIFDARLDEREVLLHNQWISANYVKDAFGDNLEVYWKKAEAKEKEK